MTDKININPLLPIFINPLKVKYLIIGGGKAGTEKLFFLLKNSPDANITIVSLEVSLKIYELSNKHSNVKVQNKKFDRSDLIDKDIVIIATNHSDLNREIRLEAKQMRLLVNVVDKPLLSDFYFGSVVTKGNLKVGISTNGKSPTFSKRFREILESILPDEVESVLDNLNKLRNSLKSDFTVKVRELNKITSNLIIDNERI
ncbi:precorrin-2 dehydrogenase/sirohydrochlorin ferrochelatase family protein [Labilibaculum euxinus]|uniref:precorrin-2 dehydrogenase/sirohydrochlorin ferrochelatase family protein n=1 Tax=Labilibaculum euxinus TaxID=2686357 RepID=UPI00177E34F4|nr:bifunctional precorrin-2 dehydrogenase/sirohydrochlorin ferrochelatase [Labilibaculum euxinus]MDQ1769295.1 bifunctional precorrin-2 dehydrogenase/sirohydrochlorin ferrochelatase [Labilibaculum euxinus]